VLITRSAFAILSGVSRQTVGGWIRDGHLTPPAVVGEGRDLRVDVDLAQAMLARRLDPAKRSAVDAEDRELIRQLRYQRVRAATLTADRLERETQAESDEVMTLKEHKAALWRASEINKTMTKECLRRLSEVVAAQYHQLDRRLFDHGLGLEFDNICRRYVQANPEIFGPAAAARMAEDLETSARMWPQHMKGNKSYPQPSRDSEVVS
jgi:hypothetical protein